MGLQGKELGTTTTDGASVIVIEQACDNDQLLVSLSKNEAQWLSPVGWTDQQKVTLLDCRPKGESTEIDIPAEFARDIKTGDVLVLRCSELDFEKEIVWEASEVEIRDTEDTTSTATGLAGGLLSRFKGAKIEPELETKSEAELRAEEADRAAQNYKAKMEAAAAAKEEAQRKALDAAREAEAALKMEAERIAEMERAAKAFEEAERLKQDELRRVEEERRAEEARLAEEARRIEEARKREIAAKKEAERKAALERYETALDITRNEETRLKNRLKDLKSKAQLDAKNMAVQEEDLQSRKVLLRGNEETASKRFASYEKTASKLDEINADFSLLQSKSEGFTADKEAINIRLSQADAEYQKAQKEAEAAMARAEARRGELELIRQEEGELSVQIDTVTEKLSAQNRLVAETSEKTAKLKAKLDTAQAELAQAKIEIDALEQTLAVQSEQDKNLRLEIEATQQAIEDSQAREIAHREAIEHLEAGGAPEDIAEIEFEPRNFDDSILDANQSESDFSGAKTGNMGLKDRMMGRVRRSFAREKEPQLSIDVEDVTLDAVEPKTETVPSGANENLPGFFRRNSSSVMALGAVIGGIAILSAGFALNKSSSPKLEVKASAPAPTQVASAVTKIDVAEAPEMTVNEDTPEAVKQDAAKQDGISEGKVDTESAKAELTPETALETEPATDTILKQAKTAIELEENAFITKLAEVVDPSGFAFELPDMQPAAQPKKPEVKSESKEAEKASPRPKAVKTKEVETAKEASVKDVTPAAMPKPKTKAEAKTEVNYPELTSDIQTRLFKLGFYNGEIDGLQNAATKEAITSFKTLFAMAEKTDKITGALLTELKRAERDQEAAERQAQREAQAQLEAQKRAEAAAARAAYEAQQFAVQVAEAAPVVSYYDTVQSVPSTPVITDSLPAADRTFASGAALPANVASEAEVVKVADVAPVIEEPAPAPVSQDIIVEAKMLKNASAKYPSAAQRRDYYVNVAIEVGYDIGDDGRAINLRILSNDHSGKYNEAFEKEAMRAVEKMRYEPKTINGVAALSTGKRKRIVFRVE